MTIESQAEALSGAGPSKAEAPETSAAGATTISILNPRTAQLVGTVPCASLADVRSALATARAAFPSWRGTPASDRGDVLSAAAERISAFEDELAAVGSAETGRPIAESLGGIRAGVDTLRQYAQLAPVHRGYGLNGAATASDYSRWEPRGVAVALTPWNDPIAVACGLIGAALATGNTVVHKPSERSPHLGARFGDLLSEVFPEGVFQTLIGGGTTGSQLVTSGGIDVVAHVGSTATGVEIERAAAGTAIHVIRENGGNDALLVDSDVDPVWAAQQAAVGAFTNSGQICTSVERIFVHRDIAAEFTAALVAEATARNDGDLLGPLVDERMRDAVHEQVAASLFAGATVLTGGFVPERTGTFYPATVLADCTAEMPVMTEETFGPVAPIMVVSDFEEALERAAADRYGLAATVLTASLANAQRAADRLPVGTVKINAVFGGAPGGSAQPRGDSGSGFGYGPELLDEMTTLKVVHIEPAVERSAPSIGTPLVELEER